MLKSNECYVSVLKDLIYVYGITELSNNAISGRVVKAQLVIIWIHKMVLPNLTYLFLFTETEDQPEPISTTDNQSEGRFAAGDIALVQWEGGAVYYCVIHTVEIPLFHLYN